MLTVFITYIFQITVVSHSFINTNPFLLIKTKICCAQISNILYTYIQNKAEMEENINPAVIFCKMSNRVPSRDLRCCLSVGLLLCLTPEDRIICCKVSPKYVHLK